MKLKSNKIKNIYITKAKFKKIKITLKVIIITIIINN